MARRTATPPTRSRFPRWMGVPLLVATGIVVGAALAEVGARILWKAPWYERLMAEQRAIQLYDYRKNKWGLRDVDYESPKPAGVKRVMMLGDSFTHGMGVPEDPLIFPEIIERKLNERPPSTAPEGVEILNAGLPATLTGDWVETLERVGREFEPDVVVIVFFLRDGTETLFIPEFFMRIRKDIVARNERSRWYQHLYTYRLVRDGVDRRNIAKEYTRRFIDAYFGDRDQTSEWRRARQNLVRLKEIAGRLGATIGLVVFPVIVDLDEDYPFEAICDEIEGYSRGIGMPVHNLLDVFRGRDASSLWVSPWDQHPNAVGHSLAAESLMPFVTEMLSHDS